MKISWFGHFSFLIQDSIGRRLFIDPIDINHIKEILNFNPKAILLTKDYNNEISSYLQSKNIFFLNNCCNYKNEFLQIKGYNSFHDKDKGIRRGDNIIYYFTFDNLTICHLGHLGHLLDDNLISIIKNVDILFIPIGGHLTIDGNAASTIANKICPKIIIPMYYRHNNSLTYLNGIKDFIFSMKNSNIELLDIFDSRHNLDNEDITKVIILKENQSII